MIICSICFLEKLESEFNFRNKEKNIYYKHCKSCQKILRHESYVKNRNYYLRYEKSHYLPRRKKKKEYIQNLKAGKPCTDCHMIFPPYVMDFDHLPQYNKSFQVGKNGQYHSIETINKEIAKCELVCSNCHRIRTFKRKNKLAVE